MRSVRCCLCLVLILGLVNIGSGTEKGLLPLHSYFAGNQPSIYNSSKPTRKRIYLAPGPLKPGKVVGEYATGCLLSVAMGVLSAAAGSRMTYDPDGGSEWNFSGLTGAFMGYWVGSTAGSTLGVCAAGNTRDEHGSAWGALAGSVIGTGAGIGLAVAVAQSDNDHFFPIFATYTLTQVSGAVLGFNLTRKRVVYESQSP